MSDAFATTVTNTPSEERPEEYRRGQDKKQNSKSGYITRLAYNQLTARIAEC